MAGEAQVSAAQQYGASAGDLFKLSTFWNRVTDFKAARAQLQKLGAQIARTNDMQAWKEYGELVARAEAIESKVSAVTGAIDSALRTARHAIGLDGLRALSALGIVWVLPLAVIATATAIIGYWLVDYAKFANRYSEQQRIAGELVAQGVDPIEAQRQAAQVAAAAAPSMTTMVGDFLKFGAILGVGLFVWYQYGRRG